MKVTFLLSGMLLLVTMLHAQKAKIDSLKSRVLLTAGTEKVDALFELGRAYDEIDNEMILNYGGQAYRLAISLGDTARIVKCGRLKAQALRFMGEMDSAEFLFNYLLPIAKRHDFYSEQKTMLNSIATIFLQTAKYDKALHLYFQALALVEIDNDKFRESLILNNIGLVYFNLRDFPNALLYFKRSLVITERQEVAHQPTNAWINVSLCLTAQKNFVEAQTFIDRVFNFCKGTCLPDVVAHARSAQGLIWYQTFDLDRAEQEFGESNALATTLGNNKLILENLGYLLSINIERRNSENTEKYLKQIEGLVAAGTPYNPEVIQVYPKLIDFYLETRNFEKAAWCQNKYIALKDSIYSRDLTVNLMRIQTQHLERENIAKIDSQSKILSLNEQVITRQYYINIFVVLVSFLLVVVIVLLVKINKRKQIVNVLLDRKVQQRTRELEINRDALQRACDERDIIIEKTAKDIKTSLVTLKGLCAVGLKDLKDEHACEYLTRVDITSDSLSTIVRNLFYVTKNRASS